MNIILIGFGLHAKRIYLKLIKKYNLNLKLIIDIENKKEETENYLKKNEIFDVELYFIDETERDNINLSDKLKKYLRNFLNAEKITHAIISTEPKAHFSYAKFLIKENINILMDKPITAPKDVINNFNQATKIRKEYEILCEEYKKSKVLNDNLIFSIQCQRRFHKGYIYIKDLIEDIISKYNIPITYIDIYHNDGMWNMPDEFIYRENHPYKYGYGKMFHSGYHFVDLLTWLLECNVKAKDKTITNASIYSEAYRPEDFMYNFNKNDYLNILKTNKYNKIFDNKDVFNNYGEIDFHSIINFYSSNKKIVTNCSLNLMQSGFSRRSWINMPKDTYKSNGRVRHERVNIQIGPLMNIQVHSYQAYEIKERKYKGGSSVGDIEHFDIYIFRNIDLIGGQVFEKIKLSDLYNIKNKTKFIGFNELAREKCFVDFVNGVENESNILFHLQSIIILEKAYKSLIYGGRKMNFDFDLNKQRTIENIVKVTDTDFDIKEKINVEKSSIRFGARGIVLNDEGKIAIIHKINKNEYKLPGGGIDENEDANIAFKRECEEEIASKVKIIKILGTAEEYKSQENFKQLSFVFVAKKILEYKENNLTEKEKDEGTEYLWLDKFDALEKMKKSLINLKESKYDSIYRTKFMVLRDIRILEYYINNFS